MKYKAILEQRGEGCDYTIGCGVTTIDIEAESMDAAATDLISIIVEEYNGERSLKSASLFEASVWAKIDVSALYKKLADDEMLVKERIAEEKEKEQYERLKAKFE